MTMQFLIALSPFVAFEGIVLNHMFDQIDFVKKAIDRIIVSKKI